MSHGFPSLQPRPGFPLRLRFRPYAAIAAALFTLAGARVAFAHGLYVVPQQSADQVAGVVRYTDDTAAAQVPIEVLSDPGRALLARGLTDAQGRFAIAVAATGLESSVIAGGSFAGDSALALAN